MDRRENSALTSADPAGRTPAVSVLVVNYQAYDELDACLSSLGRQQVKVEVIVVDQDSDEPRRRALEERHPHTRFIPLITNTGFAAGINTAARHASGTFLYLVNPDAVVAPDTTATLAEWLGQQPTVGVVGSLVLDVDGSIQGSARAFPDPTTFFSGRTAWITRAFPANPLSRRNVLTGPHVKDPITVDWVSGASMMVRKRDFDAVGGMDEGFFLYWEDADFCKRLHDAGLATAYHPGVAVTHIGGRSSTGNRRAIVAFHRSAYRYFTKHAGVVGRLASPLAYLGLGARLGLKLLARHASQPEGTR